MILIFNNMVNFKYLLFLTVLVFIIYFPILGNNFLDFWDDQWVVMNNYTERGINSENVWAILTDFYQGQYAPLNEYMYLILFNISGYDPFVFHLASMLIHTINVCLVFIVLRQILILSNRVNLEKINLISFATALLFAIHPFNVESVAWMSASKVLVYACYSFFEYLFKSILPIKLSYLYPFQSQVGEPLPKWLFTYPLILIILLVAFRKQLSKWPIALGLLIFTIHIAIALHIIPLSRYAIVADRYAYISTIGICFIISYYVIKHLNSKTVCSLFVFYILYMGIYSNQRTYVWNNTDTLKQELRDLLKQRDNYVIEYSKTFGQPVLK